MMTNMQADYIPTLILVSCSSILQTMSVNVNGFAQHMVSYYSVADVLNGRLRTPSSIGELVSLEISPEYMQKQNFRFPPVFDIGPDGLLQYKWVAFPV